MKLIKGKALLWQLLVLVAVFAGCKKYLDVKPDEKLVIPNSLEDFQSLLDNQARLNTRDPVEGEISADDYTISSADWLALSSDADKRTYVWEKDQLFEAGVNAWRNCYEAIYYTNTAIDGLAKLDLTKVNHTAYQDIKGQACFLRAKQLFQAATIWSLAYDSKTSKTDLGLPLRLNTDFNEATIRANVEDTYAQILGDLKLAANLLPIKSIHAMRASKPAAFGLLARTYLAMRDYKQAGIYADSALQLYDNLLDYNTLDSTKNYPFARFNTEVIMASRIPITQILNSSRPKVNADFYKSYHVNDLRKSMFFRPVNGQYTFKGSYEEGVILFSGIATDELYLIRAECYARNGQSDLAINDLNTLLIKRWKAGTFIPFKLSANADVLELILRERRKELLMRGLRWMDLKRLNKEGANIVLSRTVNNHTYILLPNDLRYALPIPEDVVNLAGIPQNLR